MARFCVVGSVLFFALERVPIEQAIEQAFFFFFFFFAYRRYYYFFMQANVRVCLLCPMFLFLTTQSPIGVNARKIVILLGHAWVSPMQSNGCCNKDLDTSATVSPRKSGCSVRWRDSLKSMFLFSW